VSVGNYEQSQNGSQLSLGWRAKAGTLLFLDTSVTQLACPVAMDKVFIEGLEIDALIGIYDWERRIRQTLRFDLEMGFDNRKPAASDDIADTLNYKAVSKRLIEFVSQSDYGLVETLAERCAEIVLAEFGVSWLRLKLSKPGAVRGAVAVGVIIERSRE
jgi:dihydroneopterin aldolase